MLWVEVREKFPDQFLLVDELKSHFEDGKKIVDEVAVVNTIPDSAATATLFQCKGKEIVAHTANEQLMIIVNHRFGFRGRTDGN